MFAFTKVVKLIGLFVRNPSDVMFLPVSIVFGYFHGLIKLHALFTLKMVSSTTTHRVKCRYILTMTRKTSWGSRADGDEHNNFRLQERPKRSMSMSLPSGSGQDLLRMASAAQRRATLSYHPQIEAIPLIGDFALSEKTLMSMQISPEDIMT
jgi:hypothetical protein